MEFLQNCNRTYFLTVKTECRNLLFLSVFMVFLVSCKEEGPADRLGRSEEVIEQKVAENEGLLLARYFTREELVEVNRGTNGIVKLFFVYLDEGLSQEGKANCLEGIKRFNDLRLMFRLERTLNPKKAHIKTVLVKSGDIGGVDARTLYPRGGFPGTLIKLNNTLYNKTVSKLPGNMASMFTHELGHAFGFMHIDHADNKLSCGNKKYVEENSHKAKPVDGTASSIAIDNSFMLACMDKDEDRPVLLIDQIAIYNIYGRYNDVGVPFLRYKGKNGYSNYYTSDYDELMEGNENYEAEGIIGRVFLENETAKDRIPLAYYYNAITKDHFYTNVLSELGMGKDDYEFVRLYYMYQETDGKSRVPLIRFHNQEEQKHFYTSNPTEAYELQNDKSWRYEGVIGYLNAN
ncbi:M57 family metalloprotease [Ascidiimonas sp. W6]|uniref:M57 family metalloprotease n=1 Tax=Ascidiimonas meishanensis TaxID=3128903 RepID=UPI0030EB98FB